MNEREFLDAIRALLENECEAEEDDACVIEPRVKHIATFSEAGLLTMNEGLVVQLEDGSEFQLTAVMSRKSN